VAEGHGFQDALHVGLVDEVTAPPQGTTALGAFGLQEMAFAGFGTQYLPRGGDFKPLGEGFLGLDTFWTTHKSFRFPSKERAL
jgi:hypothetical protein